MRVSTIILVVVFTAAVAGLAWSIRSAQQPTATADGRPVFVLACWGGATETQELREKVIAPINAAATDYQIRLVPIPSDYDTKLCTMIAGGTAPDLFYLPAERVPAFAQQGALADITDLVAENPTGPADLSGYYPSVLGQYRWRGRLYGLPWIAQPVVLYCNARLFRAAGVALPDGTWRWGDFVAAARQLTRDLDGDGRVDQWGFVLNTGWPPIQMWVWQNDDSIVDPQTGRLRLDAPRVVEAANFYAGLIHRAHVAPPLSAVAEAGFSEMFRREQVAMFMGGAADDLDRLEGLDVVVAEVPAGPRGTKATFAYLAGLHLSPTAARRPHAWDAYRAVLAGMHRWKIPAPRRALAAQLERFEPRKAPAADVIRRSMQYMRAPAACPRQVEYDTLFREEYEEKLLRTGVDAATLAVPAERVLEPLR